MLAVAVKDAAELTWPKIASQKVDGVRCLRVGTQALSRKFKPIPNRFVAAFLEQHVPDGVDGELFLQDPKSTFNQVQSAVMSEDGEPDFVYKVFDWVHRGDIQEPYLNRIGRLLDWWEQTPQVHNRVHFLEVRALQSVEDLAVYEAECLAAGYEGVMLRDPDGPWKNGRSTLKEGWLLKVKRRNTDEAVVVGFIERCANTNPTIVNELGYAHRSSHQDGLVGKGDLGALVLELPDGRRFNCGTGFDDAQRAAIWKNQAQYLGQYVTFAFQEHGAQDLPRFPVFLHFRDTRDMG
jgi:DNA ligase-1